MWKRLKEWFADGMGLFALLAAGLFVYLWAEDGPRAALLMATVFAVLFISVRLCSNLWMALLLRKKFPPADPVLLVLGIAGVAAIYTMLDPAMAIGAPAIGVIASAPVFIGALKIRSILNDPRE
jgi:hypothetical protein